MENKSNKNGKTKHGTGIEIEVSVNTKNLDKAIKKAKLLKKLMQEAQGQERVSPEMEKQNSLAQEQLDYFKWKAEICKDKITSTSNDVEALKEELKVFENVINKVTGEAQLNYLKREEEMCRNKVAYRSGRIMELNKELEVIENIINEMGQL